MSDPNDVADVGSLIRQRGAPEAPRSAEQVSEVRSDCFVRMMNVAPSHASFMIQPIFIQWRYRLTYIQATEFHKFLQENEQFIAESCKRVLQGVHYHGTYMGMNGQRALYTTVWGYDNWDAQDEWSKILDDKASRFYVVIRELRAYWTSDSESTQEHFGLAAGIDLEKEGFLALTVDAETAAPHKNRRR